MQQDTPVRPDESDEVRALRRLAAIAGWCVTSTTGGNHATYSLHYARATNGIGRAVDLASKVRANDTAGLIAINEQIVRLIPLSMISELIYAGGVCVKNGHIVDGPGTYGAATMAAHNNHNHLAVTLGFTYNSPEVPVPDDPDLPNSQAPIVAAFPTPTGKGYTIITADGAVFAFGDAVYYGRIEVKPT